MILECKIRRCLEMDFNIPTFIMFCTVRFGILFNRYLSHNLSEVGTSYTFSDNVLIICRYEEIEMTHIHEKENFPR